MPKLEFHISDSFISNELHVYVVNRSFDGVTSVGKPIEMDVVREHAVTRDPLGPTFSMSRSDAQVFMDALYRQGIRPAEAIKHDDALKSKNEHIADLRKIVGDLIGPATRSTTASSDSA